MTLMWNDVRDGMRLRLTEDVDRYPHFIAPAGMVGTVTDANDLCISVRMDEHLKGAEAWNNEVCFHADYDAGGPLPLAEAEG